ncbi:hypothetical protein KJ359_001712 [Pestalotiopsis sp. 9143b]|nr:hypothetical protein KJ359_001712 [Pestalotiopsis sp. 9143b]
MSLTPAAVTPLQSREERAQTIKEPKIPGSGPKKQRFDTVPTIKKEPAEKYVLYAQALKIRDEETPLASKALKTF